MKPSPVYPGLQSHLKEPWVLMHAALASQPEDPDSHSFSSRTRKLNIQKNLRVVACPSLVF